MCRIGAWRLEFGAWNLMPGIWCFEFGVMCLLSGGQNGPFECIAID